jgi:hypothetical protein
MIEDVELHLAKVALDYPHAVLMRATASFAEVKEENVVARFLCLYSAMQGVIEANMEVREAMAKLH